MLFCVLLGITAILSLTAGGLGFKLKSHTKGLIEVPMAQSMLEYQPNVYNEHTVMWDYLQKSVSLWFCDYITFIKNNILIKFFCCGLESYKDWEKLFSNQIPLSCCSIPYGVLENFSCTTGYGDINRHYGGC